MLRVEAGEAVTRRPVDVETRPRERIDHKKGFLCWCLLFVVFFAI